MGIRERIIDRIIELKEETDNPIMKETYDDVCGIINEEWED